MTYGFVVQGHKCLESILFYFIVFSTEQKYSILYCVNL